MWRLCICALVALCYQTLVQQTNAHEIKIHFMNISLGDAYIVDGVVNLTHIEGGHKLRALMILKETLGNDNKWACKVHMNRGGRLRQLLSFPGKGVCDAFNTYFGVYWKRLQALYGTPNAGECPIPKGRYTTDKYVIITMEHVKHFVKMIPPIKGTVRIGCQLNRLNNDLMAYAWGEGELID